MIPTTLAVLIALINIVLVGVAGLTVGVAVGFLLGVVMRTKYLPRLMIKDLLCAAAGMVTGAFAIGVDDVVHDKFTVHIMWVLCGAALGPIVFRSLQVWSLRKAKS
jgi:hypothetical protein